MRKALKIWLAVMIILLSLVGVVALVDRHRNIGDAGTWEGKKAIWMRESFFVDIPCEKGLDLREEGLKPFSAWLYADSINPVLKTIKNPELYYIEWITEADSGEPMSVHVIEKNALPQTVVIHLEEATVFDNIDGINVSYNAPTGDESFMLRLQNGNRIIQLQFNYTLLDELIHVLNKAWNKIKEYGE